MTGISTRYHDCEILDRDDTLLATAKGRVWRLGRSDVTPAGQRYDFAGIIDKEAADSLVNHQNRVLRINGENWRVVDTAPWPTLGYLDLALVQVAADG